LIASIACCLLLKHQQNNSLITKSYDLRFNDLNLQVISYQENIVNKINFTFYFKFMIKIKKEMKAV